MSKIVFVLFHWCACCSLLTSVSEEDELEEAVVADAAEDAADADAADPCISTMAWSSAGE